MMCIPKLKCCTYTQAEMLCIPKDIQLVVKCNTHTVRDAHRLTLHGVGSMYVAWLAYSVQLTTPVHSLSIQDAKQRYINIDGCIHNMACHRVFRTNAILINNTRGSMTYRMASNIRHRLVAWFTLAL